MRITLKLSNKIRLGFTLLDSLIGLALICSGVIFYLNVNDFEHHCLQKSRDEMHAMRKTYEHKLLKKYQ